MADSATKVFDLVTRWGNRPFHTPVGGNIIEEVQEIISGDAYRLPAQPIGYTFDTVVDIGANIGASALWFLTLPPRRLLCFEPSRESFRLLEKNLAGLPGVELHPYGLFSRDCTVPLYRGRSQIMQSSVIKSVETSDVSETITLRRAATVLAELGVDRISVLKIDTEGCEVPILTDLAALLPKVDILYLEYHSERDRRDIDTMLQKDFVLGTAHARHPHRGILMYMANRILSGVPDYANMALPRPH
jgi:FkbM family methyltransferase